MLTTGNKHGVWFWLLLLLSALYLCCELAFNSQLLNVVGTLGNADQVRHLEIEGRLISAVGLTLVLFSWLMRQLAKGRFWPSLFVLIGIASSAGPAMYFGEKALVNYLARIADARVRQHASDLLIMKKGLSIGDVKIRGVPYHSQRPTPADKTFLSLSGALVFANPRFLKEVAAKRQMIVRDTARTIAQQQVGIDYQRYKRAVTMINDDYDRYYKASSRLSSALLNASVIAQSLWAKANQRVLHAYHRYKQAEQRFSGRVERMAIHITPKLRQFLSYRHSCPTYNCRVQLDRRYRDMAARYIHSPPPWTYWCDAVTRKAHSLNLGHINLDPYGDPINVPLSIGWGKRVKTGRYRCDITVHRIQQRLIPLASERFARKTGAPPGENYGQYVQSDLVRRRFIKDAKKHGIDLPDTWTLGDRKLFLTRATLAVRRVAREQYHRGVVHLAHTYIRPNLSRWQFNRLEFIQTRAHRVLDWPSHRPVRFNMSERQFQRAVILPVAVQTGERALHRMEAKRDQLGDGERYAADGRAYVKEVIVPPIALSFSLFFGLLNFLNLGKEILFGLIGFSPRGWIKRGIAATCLFIVVVAPFAFSNHITESRTYHQMLSEAHASLGVGAWPFGWIMRAEPAIYPFGNTLRKFLATGTAEFRLSLHGIA